MRKFLLILVSNMLIILIFHIYLSIKKIEDTISINALEESLTIAFTFDDGPSVYSLDIAKELASYGYKATFFEVGSKMYDYQDTIRELIHLNMEIGSHTYSHKLLVNSSINEIQSELNSTLILFNEITEENIKLTRLPYGIVNKDIIKNASTPIIGWSIDTLDWYYKSTDHIINKILESKDGDIIIMHDIYRETLEAVKKVLPILKERGYVILSVSELARLKNKTLINGQVYNNIYN